MKKLLILLGLSLAVALFFCGCGNEKSEETGTEIKKISEEEVYELLARVEEKANKIESANLSMDQGFQEKWDLLKRKQSAADRAFSKNDYDTTSKFLQEAEAAADWIMNRGAARAEAEEQIRAASDAKSAADDQYTSAYRYAPETYQQAVQHVHQGNVAYENGNFEEAARLFRSAAATFRQAGSEAPRVCIRDMVNSLVKVEAGTFNMGSDNGDSNEKPVHQVTLSKDFYIGKYEVTQAQWKAVMGDNPYYFEGDNRPVERVNWHEAMAFCKKLNELGWAPKGYKFTLPTEAQWEFAARGGNKSKGYTHSGSNDVKDVAWCRDNSGRQTHDVGGKEPNELGIYDMSGNVCEWCLDWYGGYGEGAVTDPQGPQGPQNGPRRVIRGGSWSGSADFCRSPFRDFSSPGARTYFSGFRVALVPVQ